MIFDLRSVSGKYPRDTVVTIDTIEQLMDLVKREGSDIIVSAGQERMGTNPPIGPSLTIYDDYIE
jgi:hypothetical protein